MQRIHKYNAELEPLKSNFPFISSVINGIQIGFVYADGFDNYYVINKAGFSELILNNESKFSTEGFVDFIAECDEIPTYIHIYNATGQLIQPFRSDDRFNIKTRQRKQMRYLHQSLNFKSLKTLPNGYEIEEINNNNFNLLEVFGLKILSNFWNTKEHFLREGYGILIRNEVKMPVSVCYSASCSEGVSEIDVATIENYRGKGLAGIATSEYIKLSLKKNVNANWDCFTDNISSLQTSLKCNFTELKTYTFLSIYNKLR
ncbi:MAG: GNAT family N-acetyltransferase [Vicingus serpentipes]|nr:GNAT family N-acetyltransferase [Vicingus serpentipes]